MLAVTLLSSCGDEQADDISQTSDSTAQTESDTAPEETLKAGYAYKEIAFPWNDGETAKTVTIGIALPETWTISVKTESYSVVPFAEYALVNSADSGVGGIGFLPYELPTGENEISEEHIPQAIFSQLTLASVSAWNIAGHFDIVADNDSYCTALTSVLYTGKLFPDGQERTNSAMVSYNRELSVYIAFQIQDGTTDTTVLSAEEWRYIAESITWVSAE